MTEPAGSKSISRININDKTTIRWDGTRILIDQWQDGGPIQRIILTLEEYRLLANFEEIRVQDEWIRTVLGPVSYRRD